MESSPEVSVQQTGFLQVMDSHQTEKLQPPTQDNLTPISTTITNGSSFYNFNQHQQLVDKNFADLPPLKELNDLLNQFHLNDISHLYSSHDCDDTSHEVNHLHNTLVNGMHGTSNTSYDLEQVIGTSNQYDSTAFQTHKENITIDYEFIIENQRGFTFFGIPLFSEKTLLPTLDPPNFQYLNGSSLLVTTLKDIPLPDFNWEWVWPKWYILMLSDVDDQGWIYSRMFFSSKKWKGKYNFGNFIRRRAWCRKRIKLDCPYESQSHDNSSESILESNNESAGRKELILGSGDNASKKKRFHYTVKRFH